MHFTVSALVSLALTVAVSAVTITEPEQNAVIPTSGDFTVKWTTVNTDPSTADLFLAYNSGGLQQLKILASNVDLSKGKLSAKGTDLITGSFINIRFTAPNKPEQIYAESQHFTVTAGTAPTASQESTTITTIPVKAHSPTPGANKESSSTTASTGNPTSILESPTASSTLNPTVNNSASSNNTAPSRPLSKSAADANSCLLSGAVIAVVAVAAIL
ncbi:hypothetical protein NEOLI_003022 [Neolecta irregularis DAH-3]|uniref:Yeast cell wall synthesis Kre9/Knh1-like N-terminal domain-containing protein n=1 Tax=Neolecta irregularis (strain DAH-3) TaxID=1198029 RepID=A0A1U7LT58_NEOID|nr:hypothetical protein NEOLI_003022 [Neolecta irregularis DAH-3]|eukprot:OLL25847.1 hypothetical protein NEOLI_003022 [Neolecta irregularis DAH-3]